jgi:hypothetical protein
MEKEVKVYRIHMNGRPCGGCNNWIDTGYVYATNRTAANTFVKENLHPSFWLCGDCFAGMLVDMKAKLLIKESE